MKRGGLGKGLSALLDDKAAPSSDELIKIVDIGQISAGEFQPRKYFDESKIDELAESIRNKGLLQPIIVRPSSNGHFTIIAGERRWRACSKAGFTEIPVIVKNLTDLEALEIGIIENVQRHDLSSIEEAEAYARLTSEFSYTQERLAKALGKSRGHISNLLRLTQLPAEIKKLVDEDKLSMGHARCLVGSSAALEIAHYIIENNLSVRQTEQLIKDWQSTLKVSKAAKKKQTKDKELIDLAKNLSEKLGLKVTIESHNNKGKISLHYKDLKSLDTILSKL